MPDYTTGELARLCGITVRTVQFYDARGFAAPIRPERRRTAFYSEKDPERCA
ncbi:MAG: MerR family transcriptional regulator [Eubacteriales bacterium]